jgi:hypothetical protein
MSKFKKDVDMFVKEEQAALKNFQSYWHRKHKEDPVNFPEKIEYGEWNEQYLAYRE